MTDIDSSGSGGEYTVQVSATNPRKFDVVFIPNLRLASAGRMGFFSG